MKKTEAALLKKDPQLESPAQMLQVLMKEYQMGKEQLSRALEVSPAFFDDIPASLEALALEKRGLFLGKLMTLRYLPVIPPDERNRGVLDVLLQDYGFTYDTIAAFAGIPAETLRAFHKDTGPVDYEQRYRLATVLLFLHFLLKPKEQ